MSALNNEELFSSRQPPGVNISAPPEVMEIYAQGYPPVDTLLTNDPPAHTRYRVLVTKAFSARRVATLEPKVREIAAELVDKFARDGKVELMSQFAVGLPMTVIADALGVPREDMDKFKRWSDDSVAPLGGMISAAAPNRMHAQHRRVPALFCGQARGAARRAARRFAH